MIKVIISAFIIKIKQLYFPCFFIINYLSKQSKQINYQMNRQSQDKQKDNQSDNDEGFIPSKIIIKQKNQISIKKQQKKDLSDKQFIPRYITEGIIRKQPVECYKRFSHFDFLEQPVQGRKITSDNKINHKIQNQLNKSLDLQQRFLDENQSEIVQKRQISLSPLKNKNKQKPLTPYDKYVSSGQFILVYNRYKDFKFAPQQINFAGNQVKLDCLRSLDDVKFKPIKPFQIIQQKSQQIFTQQGLNRNNSIKQSLLQFDSKFQCGNLLCAYKNKKQPYCYDLFIQNDTNTYGYNQWFYFSIKNAQRKIKYKFNIVNFRKRHSFFKQGNKPVVFSLLDSKKDKKKSGYSKKGMNVVYGKSQIIKSYQSKQKFFQLSFQLEFDNDDDVYYISMGLPYSYSKLLHNINLYENVAKQNNLIWSMESVGISIANNKIPYITITKIDNFKKTQEKQDNFDNLTSEPSSTITPTDELKYSQSFQNQKTQKNYQTLNVSLSEVQSSTKKKLKTFYADSPEKRASIQKPQYSYRAQNKKQKQKKVILLIGRQHPGQTWSSYLMDQFIYEIVSQKTQQSRYLVQNFIIKCIPMINVDGVIMGNFRCDLTGMDLNRNWKTPSSLLHPQIYSIKNQILNLVNNKGYKIQTVFDLHGHSKEYNIFCYSCKTDNYESRLLPYIFHELNKEFHFPFCTFGISRYKQSTARAVVFDIIRNPNVLTIQSSFFGSAINGKTSVFQPIHFSKMASTLIKGCKSYFSQDGLYKSCKQIVHLRMAQFLQYKSESNVISGSDSQPSEDEIQLKQKLQNIIPKNLIQECIEIQTQKKFANKKGKKSVKRQTFQIAPQRTSYKAKKTQYVSQNKNRTIDIIKDQSPTKQLKSNWESIKRKRILPDELNKTNHFKKNSVIMSSQTIEQNDLFTGQKRSFFKDLIEKQEHKLPFFTKQKTQMIPLKLKNQSFEIFRDAYNATQKQLSKLHNNPNQTSLQDIRNQRRAITKKLGIFKQKNQKDQQFPLLCVLSENKKKSHAQKIKQRRQSNHHSIDSQKNNVEGMGQKVKTAIQTRTQAIKQLRQKNKNSMQLVSKIWRQNFTRYGMAFSTFKISK